MSLIHEDSLALTLDAVNEAFFYNRTLPETEKKQVARWIADRQGKPEGISIVASTGALTHSYGCARRFLLRPQTGGFRYDGRGQTVL